MGDVQDTHGLEYGWDWGYRLGHTNGPLLPQPLPGQFYCYPSPGSMCVVEYWDGEWVWEVNLMATFRRGKALSDRAAREAAKMAYLELELER